MLCRLDDLQRGKLGKDLCSKAVHASFSGRKTRAKNLPRKVIYTIALNSARKPGVNEALVPLNRTTFPMCNMTRFVRATVRSKTVFLRNPDVFIYGPDSRLKWCVYPRTPRSFNRSLSVFYSVKIQCGKFPRQVHPSIVHFVRISRTSWSTSLRSFLYPAIYRSV